MVCKLWHFSFLGKLFHYNFFLNEYRTLPFISYLKTMAAINYQELSHFSCTGLAECNLCGRHFSFFGFYSKYWLLIFTNASNWYLSIRYTPLFNDPQQTLHLIINIMVNSAHVEPLCMFGDQYCPLKHLYCIVVLVLLVCLSYRSQEDSGLVTKTVALSLSQHKHY